MSLQSLKLLFFAVAAAFEVSLIHLGATLIAVTSGTGTNLNWALLFGVCLIAAWTTARFEAGDDDRGLLARPWLVLLAICTTGYVVKVQAGGGWSLWSGWSVLSPFSSPPENASFGSAALLLVTLAVWWRGMVLLDHDHASLLSVLQRGVLGLVLLALLSTPVAVDSSGEAPWGALLGLEAVLWIALGLLSLSLARIVEQVERQPGTGGWRALRSSLIIATAVIVVGTVLLSIFSDTATLVLRVALALVGGFVVVLFAPLISPLFRFFTWLMAGRSTGIQPNTPPDASITPDQETQVGGMIQWVEVVLSALSMALYLLPLLALLLLILFARRQRKVRMVDEGELHESLWSWRAVGTDLLSTLRGLRPASSDAGLREALARLRSDDPVQRIRRRYIQLLMAGEAVERPRNPQHTPLEHETSLASVVSTDDNLHTLTEVYDRARYAPDTINPPDADTADIAWTAIAAQIPEENR